MRVVKACAGIVKPAECASYFAACGYDTTWAESVPNACIFLREDD
jgi:hypothetical protein